MNDTSFLVSCLKISLVYLKQWIYFTLSYNRWKINACFFWFSRFFDIAPKHDRQQSYYCTSLNKRKKKEKKRKMREKDAKLKITYKMKEQGKHYLFLLVSFNRRFLSVVSTFRRLMILCKSQMCTYKMNEGKDKTF